MSEVVAIGEEALLDGYALAFVEVIAAGDPSAVREAWESLEPEVELVILTPAAHEALAPQLRGEPRVMWVVVPE